MRDCSLNLSIFLTIQYRGNIAYKQRAGARRWRGGGEHARARTKALQYIPSTNLMSTRAQEEGSCAAFARYLPSLPPPELRRFGFLHPLHSAPNSSLKMYL